MIVKPENWSLVGVPVSLDRIEHAMLSAVDDTPCACLSFSGGIDSCLLLYFLLKLERKVRTFTIACSPDHPDIHFSHVAIQYFRESFKVPIESYWFTRPKLTGDDLVRSFYSIVSQQTDAMIAGDGIDELMCGYYAHQSDSPEVPYYDFLRRLQKEHLEPLNDNSGTVRMYLPYLDDRVTTLLWQVPLSERVSLVERKKLMVRLALSKVPDEIIARRKYGFATKLNEEDAIRAAVNH